MTKTFITTGLVALAVLAATPNIATARDKRDNTVLGAGIGLLGGALLSHGDPWASVAGAAAGGAIGNLMSSDRRDEERRVRDDRRDHGDRGRRDDWDHGRGDRNNDRDDSRHPTIRY